MRREDGASLLVFSSDWDHAREARHLRALRQARVDGAIINPVADNFDDLDRFGLPFVLIGSSAERFPETSSVGSDIAQAVRLGMDHLVSKGHRRALRLSSGRNRASRGRGSCATVHDHCVERDIDPASLPSRKASTPSRAAAPPCSACWHGRRVGHLAVFAANDLMALGAMMAVREAGLDCPRDVSILGFDGVPAGRLLLAGADDHRKAARARSARRAVESLLDEIAGRPDHGRIYLPCRLIERGSLADLPSRASPRKTA